MAQPAPDTKLPAYQLVRAPTIEMAQSIIDKAVKEGWRLHSVTAVGCEYMPRTKVQPHSPCLIVTFEKNPQPTR